MQLEKANEVRPPIKNRAAELLSRNKPREVVSVIEERGQTEQSLKTEKNYRGDIFIEGEKEGRSLVLKLNFIGGKISGTAQILGYGDYSVSGQVLPRGLSLTLSREGVTYRLSGSERNGDLRGRYFSSKQGTGSWTARFIEN